MIAPLPSTAPALMSGHDWRVGRFQRLMPKQINQILLVSSPYDRCVQTLEPLARRLGLPIEPRDELAEGEPGPAALALVRGLAGAMPVLSTHGDVVALLCGDDAPRKKGSEAEGSSRGNLSRTCQPAVPITVTRGAA